MSIKHGGGACTPEMVAHVARDSVVLESRLAITNGTFVSHTNSMTMTREKGPYKMPWMDASPRAVSINALTSLSTAASTSSNSTTGYGTPSKTMREMNCVTYHVLS